MKKAVLCGAGWCLMNQEKTSQFLLLNKFTFVVFSLFSYFLHKKKIQFQCQCENKFLVKHKLSAINVCAHTKKRHEKEWKKEEINS